MRSNMSKNDEQLVKLIKDVVSGNQDKEVFCKEFYKEVYALVYPVFGDNSKKVTSRAFIYLCNNIDKIDVSKNIHRQVATLVSAFMFGLIDKNTIKNNVTGLEYEFNRIKEDAELYNIIRDNVKMFRNPADYDNTSEAIRSLSRVQTILLELYGYEMHSVDEIEELLDVDSAFICELIVKTKAQMLGVELETEESEYEEENGSDDEYEADRYETEDGAQPDALYYESEETDDDSEPEDDEKSYFEDDDIEDDSDEHPFRRTKADRSAAMRRADASNPVVRKLAGVVGKLFPSLSQAARRIVVYVAGGVILFAIVLSVFLSAVLSGDSKTAAKKNNNSNNTRVTTAETTTSKEKVTQAKATKKADDTTAADNEAVKETTKADESTEENTKRPNKATIKDAEEETVEDSASGIDDNNGGEEEKDEKETEPSTEATEATTKVTEETEATEETTKATEATKATETTKATDETKTTEAVDNTTVAADVNANNN
jgi:hypothetical protein